MGVVYYWQYIALRQRGKAALSKQHCFLQIILSGCCYVKKKTINKGLALLLTVALTLEVCFSIPAIADSAGVDTVDPAYGESVADNGAQNITEKGEGGDAAVERRAGKRDNRRRGRLYEISALCRNAP